MVNLFPLNQKQMMINDMLDESYGEITTDIKKAIENLESDKENIVFDLIAIMKEQEARIAGLEHTKTDIEKKIKEAKNKSEKVKHMADSMFFELNKKSIQNDQFKVSLRTMKKSVLHIENENKIPEQFKKISLELKAEEWSTIQDFCEPVKLKESIKKNDLKKAVKEGLEIEGISLTDKQFTVIK